MKAWTSWACSGDAVRPVPIAQTGSYASTTPAICSALRPASDPVELAGDDVLGLPGLALGLGLADADDRDQDRARARRGA